MTAVAWWIFVGGVMAAYGGLTYDRGGIYAGLVTMAACVWADWLDSRQKRRLEQERLKRELERERRGW